MDGFCTSGFIAISKALVLWFLSCCACIRWSGLLTNSGADVRNDEELVFELPGCDYSM